MGCISSVVLSLLVFMLRTRSLPQRIINLKRGRCFYIIVKCTSRRARHACTKEVLAVDLNFKLTRPMLVFTRSSS